MEYAYNGIRRQEPWHDNAGYTPIESLENFIIANLC